MLIDNFSEVHIAWTTVSPNAAAEQHIGVGEHFNGVAADRWWFAHAHACEEQCY